jgi:hypothetical protein
MGCGNNAKMAKFADRMCECKDKDCAASVLADYDDFVKANPTFKGSGDSKKEFNKSMVRFLQCRSDLNSPDGKPTELPQ